MTATPRAVVMAVSWQQYQFWLISVLSLAISFTIEGIAASEAILHPARAIVAQFSILLDPRIVQPRQNFEATLVVLSIEGQREPAAMTHPYGPAARR